MKKIVLYLVMAILISGCTKEDIIITSEPAQPPTSGHPIDRIQAGISQTPETRVGINIGGGGVPDKYYWISGDQIVLCELNAASTAFTGNNYVYTLQTVPAPGAIGFFSGAGLDGGGNYVAIHTRTMSNVVLPVNGSTAFTFNVPNLTQSAPLTAANLAVVQAFADNLLFTSDKVSGATLITSGVPLKHRLAQLDVSITGDAHDNGKHIDQVELAPDISANYSPSISFDVLGTPTPLAAGGAKHTTVVTDPNAKLSSSSAYKVRLLVCPRDLGNIGVKLTCDNIYSGPSMLTSIKKNPGIGQITTVPLTMNPTGLIIPLPPEGGPTYTGAYWKKNEKGERIIRLNFINSDLGNWNASVIYKDKIFKDDDIIMSVDNILSDPGVQFGYVATPNSAELYPVAGTSSVSGNITSNGVVQFRIGLNSYFAGNAAYSSAPDYTSTFPARYAIIKVSYANDKKYLLLFLRQGEDPDRIRWDKSPRFATCNVQSVGSFTDFPTKSGRFKMWTASPVMVDPTNPSEIFPSPPHDDSFILNVCPTGYHIPTGETDAYDASTSEMAALVYKTPSLPTAAIWGYYADGYFDRRMIQTSHNFDGLNYAKTTVLPNTSGAAFIGRLAVNSNTGQSFFYPSAGHMSGQLYRSGDNAVYWTKSKSLVSSLRRRNLYVGSDATSMKEQISSYGFLIRCVSDVQ